MNCLIIGYGSIGQRHARILKELNCGVSIVSKRDININEKYLNIKDALIKVKPEYVVISNETNKHYDSLMELVKYGFDGLVLIEKPLFKNIQNIPDNNFKGGYVAYNLRFHPILQKVVEAIRGELILFANVYVGQYLPSWRQGRDYRNSYSARRNEGGGVLLDLSHELDYIGWLFGEWRSVTAIGGKYSSLEIDSDDLYSVLITMEKCPMVQLSLNYLDKISRRELTVITENYSIKADLVKQILQINDTVLKCNVDRDYTYNLQHKAIKDGNYTDLCSLDEGLKVLELINIIEHSSKERKWIDR